MDLYEIRSKLNRGLSLKDINLRVTDYARVSTEHEEQKKSLKHQIEHFSEYIKSNENWVYVSGYVDDGISGTSDIKRSNFMRMIDDAKDGKFDLIVTKEISRFSRNTMDSIKYTRLLLEYGVAVLFVNDNINTALPDSELRLAIMASMAQDEVRRLSDRVKFGMNRAILNGEILGNGRLYGYIKDKFTGSLVVVDEEALVVRRIFELYVLRDLSLNKIVNILNEECIRSSEGKKWSVTGVARIIRNPKYKGYYCGRKSEVIDYMTKRVKIFDSDNWVMYEDKEKVPPIIVDYLWDRANSKLNERRKGKRERRLYLYSGKIYCGICGSLFNRRIFRRNKKDVTWVCSKHLKEGSIKCNCLNIRECELEVIFSLVFSKMGIDKEKIVSFLIDKYISLVGEDVYEKEIINYQKKQDDLKLKKEKLLELFIDGGLSEDEFLERNSKFNNGILEIDDKIRDLENKKETFLNNSDKEKWFNFLYDKVYSKEVLEKIINFIVRRIVVRSSNDGVMILSIYFGELGSFDDLSGLSKEGDGEILVNCEFERGYDVVGTRRYKVYYNVNCYFL